MATVEKRKHWVIIYQNKINSINARIVRQYHSIPTTPALILKSHNKIPLRDFSLWKKHQNILKSLQIYFSNNI